MKPTNFFIAGLAMFITTGNLALAQNPDADMREQMDRVRQQTDQARKALEAARGEIAAQIVAQDKSSGVKHYTTRLQSIIRRASPQSRVLVIPKDSGGTNDIAEVEEDLTVMAHILNKAVGENSDRTAHAMGIEVTPRWSGFSTGPQNLYIQGFGALFFLNVDFPLLPPPVQKGETKIEEHTSSEWERARRELFEPRVTGGGGGGAYGGYGGPASPTFPKDSFAGPAPVEYDTDRVEELKKDLITELKNAANIRKLMSDETATVVVTGPRATSGSTVAVSVSKSTGNSVPVLADLPQLGRLIAPDYSKSGPEGSSSKLILRVRKSDAEAFQKGELSYDEFRKKVTMIVY